ncbi:uncharacterized protein LOC132044880 [Lycium ferocissimum]|uniref:uncharacterized protein LOC132044880 n=1 Tax=Lycium ferocissimum TaxID=112874 RepID=UPI002815483A|nr:uncharacterized protein LOC132044880 [Lycium ferocissimum]
MAHQNWGVGNQFGNKYNSNYQNNYQQPQGQQVSNSLEETIKQWMSWNQQMAQQQRQQVINEMQKFIHELESQMGQMVVSQTVRPQGALPSNTEKNPKEQLHDVSLRNGRQLEEVPPKNKKKSVDIIAEQSEVVACRPPPSFPQRLQKQKVDSACKKFLEILKQVHINIPLVELLQEVPKYVMHIKDIIANKRRLTEFEHLLKNAVPGCGDPGSFTISITIGSVEIRRALCDLGASINMMPTCVFKTLVLVESRPTTVTLQLADRSLAYPNSIIEDVLVKVGPFILPVDFIILGNETDKQVPLLLRRGFLANVDAIIQVKEGKISMTVDGQEATFDMFIAIKLPPHYEKLKLITIAEPELTSADLDYFVSSKDTLERALVYSEELEGDEKVQKCLFILDTTCTHVQGNKPFEELKSPDTWKKPKPSIEEASVERVLRVLRDRIRAPGWTIADIRAINSSFCMHKKLMEKDSKPSIELQRRLNPIMKEVVKKEVLDRLVGHDYYSFLDGYSGYNQIMIAPEDQEKTTFTCPYGTLHSGGCRSGYVMHQHLDAVLARCKETNLVLNCEKCHFIVREGIVLDHKVSHRGVEVDKAKVEVVERLPPLSSVKRLRSFLGHVGSYR